jgi:hypothetical protein
MWKCMMYFFVFKNKKVTKNKVKISLSFVQVFENEQKIFTNERNVKNKVS